MEWHINPFTKDKNGRTIKGIATSSGLWISHIKDYQEAFLLWRDQQLDQEDEVENPMKEEDEFSGEIDIKNDGGEELKEHC